MIRINSKIIKINNSIPYFLDVDASKVIDAVRSTGVIVTPAIMHYAHYLISNMKAIGTWDLCTAVYGFVGGTANSHAINWKTIGTYNLTYSGTITHSSNGFKPETIVSYARSFIAANLLSQNSRHLCINSFDDYQSGSGITPIDIGARLTPSFNGDALSNYASSTYPTMIGQSLDGGNYPNSNGAKGFGLITRTSATNVSIIRNQTLFNYSSSSSAPSIVEIIIGACNDSSSSTINPGNGSLRTLNFSSIGAGFTDVQALQQSQIVTNAQAILNRL